MYKEILCNFNNIMEAYRLAHRSKTNCLDVIEFDKNKTYNLNKILNKLENKKWEEIFKYYRFQITVPKQRIIDAMTFEGRIVQHILCDKILKPYFENRLVKENAACRVGKGTDYAINNVKQNIVNFLKSHEDGYYLKIDIKKYFPSINRDILKFMISDFPDDEIKELLYFIIDNGPEDIGLPIGNQSSQWFALYFIDKLDRIIKEKYKIKYYSRYMDDMIVIHEDKRYLKNLLYYLTEVSNKKLDLEFNSKTQIIPLHKGISYLGWKIKYDKNHKLFLIIDGSKKPIRKRKLREIMRQYELGIITKEKVNEKLDSMISYLKRGNTYYFRKKIEGVKQ